MHNERFQEGIVILRETKRERHLGLSRSSKGLISQSRNTSFFIKHCPKRRSTTNSIQIKISLNEDSYESVGSLVVTSLEKKKVVS